MDINDDNTEQIDAGASDAPAVQPAADEPKETALSMVEKGLADLTDKVDPDAFVPAKKDIAKPEAAKVDETAKPALPTEAQAEVKPMEPGKPAEKETLDDLYKVPDLRNEESKRRFHALVDDNKALRTQMQERETSFKQINDDVEHFRKIIDDSQATPQEFMELIDYSKRVKTGDLEGALQILDAQRHQLALAMGKPLEGTNVLRDHPDLQAEVESMQITQERAIEIAQHRGAQQRSQTIQQQQQRQQAEEQPRQAFEQAKQAAAKQIDSLCSEWASKDLDFPAKEKIILEAAQEIGANFPPNMWANQIKILYNSLGKIGPQRQQQQQPAVRPLRPGAGGGGAAKPKSALEALNQGLGYAD